MNGQNQNRYSNYNRPNNNNYGQLQSNNIYPYQQKQMQSNYYVNPQQSRYNQNMPIYNKNIVPPNYNTPNNNININNNNKKVESVQKEFNETVEKKENQLNPKKEEIHNPAKEVEIIEIEPVKNTEEIENENKTKKNENIKEENKPKTTEFSVLERYGEDITKKEYVTNPAIAREEEIGKLILVLLTPDKSACLVGKPGIGKTAIVEGLAYRILHDDVPNMLKGYSIINVATSSLLGESISDGERESRIQLLVNEVMKADKIILFIDEIHTLMGAGAKDGSALDFANILKPALARGNVKLIGATTSDEYERYMIRDRAFIRRFEKIEIAEPDIPTTVKILMGSYPRIEKKTGVKLAYTDYVKEQLMTFIVEMTSEYKRFYEVSSRYPDISLALLSKAFSFAMYENSDEVRIRHFWMAINTCESIYPDSRAKEVQRFKSVFADIIKEENLDVNAPINI